MLLRSMYDRALEPIPEAPTTGLRARIEALVGITVTGYRWQLENVGHRGRKLSSHPLTSSGDVLSLIIFEVRYGYCLLI